MPRFEWYDVTQSREIEQGDILENVDIYIPLPHQEGQEEPVPSRVETHDVIILTQSCDIIKPECQHLVVCPVWTLEEAKQEVAHFRTGTGCEDLRKGWGVGYHLLDRCDKPNFRRDFRVVNFYRVFELPKSRVMAIVGAQSERLRLLPPFREHMSQAFARFFMRVGLPVDIPAFV